MNADLSIHRMAFREADSLGVAQALVVKKRQDLELQLLRERANELDSPAGAGLDSALRRMDDASRLVDQSRAESLAGLVFDKTA